MPIPTTIVGNLTADPELKFTPSGAPVANFSVAVDHRRLNQQTNTWETTSTDYYRCAAWRALAENVAETLTKGMQVIVVGTIKQEVFERRDGSKGMAVNLTVDEIGPSLRFATAQVQRRERNGGFQPQQPQAQNQQGWGGQQQAQPQQQGGAWGGQQQGAGRWGEEPPF